MAHACMSAYTQYVVSQNLVLNRSCVVLIIQGISTVPGTLGEEKATNPFLRAADPELRRSLGLGLELPNWQVFSAIRSAKDSF